VEDERSGGELSTDPRSETLTAVKREAQELNVEDVSF
jgi:hypothetical protein